MVDSVGLNRVLSDLAFGMMSFGKPEHYNNNNDLVLHYGMDPRMHAGREIFQHLFDAEKFSNTGSTNIFSKCLYVYH